MATAVITIVDKKSDDGKVRITIEFDPPAGKGEEESPAHHLAAKFIGWIGSRLRKDGAIELEPISEADGKTDVDRAFEKGVELLRKERGPLL